MTKDQFIQEVLPIQHSLYRYVLSIVFEEELAKDIVQEVLLKLWDQRVKLSTINNIEAWGIRVARNLAYDKLRLANRRTEPIDRVVHQFVASSFPDKEVESEDLLQAVKELMQDLPEKQQEIFRLRELLGYSNAEIEEILSLDRNQVKVNLFRARQKIKANLLRLINYGLDE